MTFPQPRDRRGDLARKIVSESPIQLDDGVLSEAQDRRDRESDAQSDRRWAQEAIRLIDRIDEYVGRGEEDFCNPKDDRTFESTQMRIVNLGHAIDEMSRELRHEIGPDTSLLHKMRSRLAHDCLRVDAQIVWRVAVRDIPNLRWQIEEAIERLYPES